MDNLNRDKQHWYYEEGLVTGSHTGRTPADAWSDFNQIVWGDDGVNSSTDTLHIKKGHKLCSMLELLVID